MEWHDLLFMHWPLPAAELAPHIPPGLTLDTYAGEAWIGIVPFTMRGVRPRAIPALPWISAFAELNVRTYVTAEGKPGVWFWSLDAANPLAVRAARIGAFLPYFDARMRAERVGDGVRYESVRTHRGAPAAELRVTYRPTGPAARAQPGTLDEWLAERYCLYSRAPGGQLWRGEIHHQPWPLQPAKCEISANTMTAGFEIALPNRAPLLHFARQLNVVAWPLQRVK